MDPRNFAIGVLSTTATILLVGIVLLYSRPEAARADGMTTSGASYIVTVGSLTKGDEEVVYVVDTSTDKMLVYRFDGAHRQIEIAQGVDLAEARRASTPPGQQPAGAGPSKPRTRQP